MVPLLLLLLAQQPPASTSNAPPVSLPSGYKPDSAKVPPGPLKPAPLQTERTLAQRVTDLEEVVLKLIDSEPTAYELKFDIDELKADAKLLRTELYDDVEIFSKFADPVPTAAKLNPSSTGFAPLRTYNNGFLILVSLDSVEPYLDGFKAKLRIGNTSTATLSGLDLKFRWGPGERPTRSGEVSTASDLLSGTWTPVDAILPNTKADQVGSIEVSARSERVVLRRQ